MPVEERLPKQQSLVRLGALSGLDRTLIELGVDPAPVFAGCGLSVDALADGDRLIPMKQAAELLEAATVASGREHFALELAAHQDENLLGAIGLLVQTAETVREAMQDVSRYLSQTHVTNVSWTLVRRGEFESFEVSAEWSTLGSHQLSMVIQLAVAQSYRIFQSVTGGRLAISAICFRQGEPSVTGLGRFFKPPIKTSAEFDGLLFERGALDLKIPRGDVQAHEAVRRLLQERAPLSVTSLADEVKVLIRPLLPTGQCSIERIARFFACDKRSLQRRLRRDCDTSYQQLLDEVRFDAACYYLGESDMPITQVTYLAGFTEPTNFSRAFRQRFGVSPREWRSTGRAHG